MWDLSKFWLLKNSSKCQTARHFGEEKESSSENAEWKSEACIFENVRTVADLRVAP